MNGLRMEKQAKYELVRVSHHYTDILFFGRGGQVDDIICQAVQSVECQNIRPPLIHQTSDAVDDPLPPGRYPKNVMMAVQRQLARSRHPETEVVRSQQQKRDVVDY